MSEDTTEELPGKKSFEARVFERFDAMDVRLNTVDARLEKLEARSYDTKPIWEQALREIVETRAEVGEVHSRVALLEIEVAAVKANYGGIKNDFEDLKRELVRQLTRRLDLVLKALVDTRDEMAAAEERITKLESQLA